LVVVIITQITRVLLLKQLIEISLEEYFIEVVLKTLLVTCVSIIAPIAVYTYIPEGFLRFILVCVTSFFGLLLGVFTFGFNNKEKEFLLGKLKDIFAKFSKSNK
jgi:hypothetical protein